MPAQRRVTCALLCPPAVYLITNMASFFNDSILSYLDLFVVMTSLLGASCSRENPVRWYSLECALVCAYSLFSRFLPICRVQRGVLASLVGVLVRSVRVYPDDFVCMSLLSQLSSIGVVLVVYIGNDIFLWSFLSWACSLRFGSTSVRAWPPSAKSTSLLNETLPAFTHTVKKFGVLFLALFLSLNMRWHLALHRAIASVPVVCALLHPQPSSNGLFMSVHFLFPIPRVDCGHYPDGAS